MIGASMLCQASICSDKQLERQGGPYLSLDLDLLGTGDRMDYPQITMLVVGLLECCHHVNKKKGIQSMEITTFPVPLYSTVRTLTID